MPGQDRGDFSRMTFDPLNHFCQVFSQQGRVELDADGNEQGAILLHHLRALAADVIGPVGGPSSNLGFTISAISSTAPNDFRIGLGHYYVGGLLCEADATPIAIVTPI